MPINPVKPDTKFGNTAGEFPGSAVPSVFNTSSTQRFGEIDYETLNRSRFSDVVEFSKFYSIIKDSILSRLGAPVIRVELTDHQILTVIDEAVSKLDFHSPNWCTNYTTFRTIKNRNLYEMPRFVMNNLQFVAYKKSLLSVAQQEGTLEFDFFIKYFQDNFLFKDFQITDFLLMTMHLEQLRKILGREGTFEVVDNKYIAVYPVPQEVEEVIVQFRSLNSDTLHPFYVNWLQKYATAHAKVILGGIRGKYSTLPSPGGGARLNGDSLVQEGTNEMEKLEDVLFNEIEEPPAFTAF
jgi:hypothetical protein|tara:strand:+ start:366 stop:1250 length:885 start_codon:yes stop_codon:yes gene_type:complete